LEGWLAGSGGLFCFGKGLDWSLEVAIGQGALFPFSRGLVSFWVVGVGGLGFCFCVGGWEFFGLDFCLGFGIWRWLGQE